MTIFNGVLGLGLIYSIWCTTYFLSWYGLYDNPQEITAMRQDPAFTLIPAGFLIAPLAFYIMAFVNTFSLVHNKTQDEYLGVKESLWFVLKKIIKLTPFNIVVLWWGAGLGPTSSKGPYWDLYPKAMKGCLDGNWVFNMAFVQNILPPSYDEKCMPWTWFIPCYVQLCVTLPLLIMVYQRLPKVGQLFCFSLLLLAITVGNFFRVYNGGTGIFLTFDQGVYLNYDFLNQIFMLPYFHLAAHLYGFLSCMWFLSYVHDKSINNSEPSSATRMFTFVRNNASLRYVLYLLGAVLMSWIVFGLHGYLQDSSSWSAGLQAFYGGFAYPIYPFGASLFLLPALTGRAEFVRFFFGGELWVMFRSVAYGLYLWVPLYGLTFFLSMGNSQHLDYQMMFYNFCGILIFSLIFTYVFLVFCDRPVHAMLNLRHDLKMVATESTLSPETAFNIEDFKKKKNDGEEEQPLVDGDDRYIRKVNYIPPVGNNVSVGDGGKSTTMFDFSNSNNQQLTSSNLAVPKTTSD
jgi:hypothetical protein